MESLNHYIDKVLINRINDNINEGLKDKIDEAVKAQLDKLSENTGFIARMEMIFTNKRGITEYLNSQINTMVTSAIPTNLEEGVKEQI